MAFLLRLIRGWLTSGGYDIYDATGMPPVQHKQEVPTGRYLGSVKHGPIEYMEICERDGVKALVVVTSYSVAAFDLQGITRENNT